MFSYIVKLLKSLNTNSHPGEIAHAVAIGVLLGFMPKNNVLWYLLFVFFLFVRMNRGAFLLTILIASLLAQFFDPLFDSIGYAVLTFSPLKPTYAALLDVPFVAFTKFNNTIPVYIVTRVFIKSWRTYLAPALARSKFVQALYHVPFVAKITSFFTEV